LLEYPVQVLRHALEEQSAAFGDLVRQIRALVYALAIVKHDIARDRPR
jgi:hypothetical protein